MVHGCRCNDTRVPKNRNNSYCISICFGAFGIMTLNDFKALKGDTVKGVNSLPVSFWS